MLRSLRDGAKQGWLKYILLGILVLAGGGLVLTDVGGFFRGGISTNLVAKGSGIEISTAQFDRNVRRILSRQGMSPQEAYNLGLINQILNSEIQTQILTREARKLGVNISDKVVTEQIAKIAEPLARDGISKSDALKQVLRSQGVSEGEFVQSIRQEMGNTLFRNALLGGASGVTKAEATALYRFQNEARTMQGFELKNNNVKDITEPTEINLEKFYDANKSDFATAEKRSVTIATLKQDMLADSVAITENELRDVYENNLERYQKPEQRKLQQAILSTQNDAQDVLNAFEKSKDLKKAVKNVTGKTAAYLGENDFEQNGLLEEISTPVFEAEQGATLGPLQTALGWHVLVLKEIIEPQVTPFDKVKASLKENMLQDRLAEELVDAANHLDDQLAGGEELEVVVKEMGLTTEQFKNFNQAGTDDKGTDLFAQYQGDKAQILEAAYDYDTGEASPVLELADGRFVTVRVDNVQPLSYRPYEEVKASLRDRWISNQRELANIGRSQDALTKLKEGASLGDIAKEFGASIKTYSNIKRGEAPKAPLNFVAARTIFDAEENTPLKIDIDDGFIIGEVTSITLPSADKADKEIAKIQEESAQMIPQEIMAQFINTLSLKYDVKINNRVLEMVYGAQNDGS